MREKTPEQRFASKAKAKARREAGERGWGNPPEKYRFKPGQSGNPKGRPKGRKNHATIVQEVLDQKLEIRGSGKLISRREALYLVTTEKGLKGNLKSAEYILKKDEEAERSRKKSEV